jgi:GDP/UDP-N,N'-diacetylbacillosamine 2-epimerase (hydrolysing)
LTKRKVCLIITTRGNYAKMKSVIQAIEADPEMELQLIVGGGALLPKYGNVVKLLIENDIKIDRHIQFLVEGENTISMAKSAGLAITEFSTAFENLNPDVVLVIADRFECLPIAMAAGYMNIPVAHIEGGEVSGSIDESIRHAITKLSHLHFPATESAAMRIEKLGEDAATIFPIGATSFDVISSLNLDDITPLTEIQNEAGVGALIDFNKPYFVVIMHPVTTEYSDNLSNVNEAIEAICSIRIGTVWIWPNMDAGSDGISKGIRELREAKRSDFIRFFKSLPIELFAPLLKNCACILGNSSSGIREASFLGVPCVNIGTRQNGRDRAENVINVGYDREEVKRAVLAQLEHGPYEPSYLYGNANAGKKLVEILKKVEFRIQKRITY